MKEILKIQIDKVGTFLSRPNRFLANVEIDGNEELAHVHDPGRLRELLYAGNKIQLRKAKNKNRKTAWDVITANSDDGWILINSSFHRWISEGILKNERINPLGKISDLKAEVKYNNSRLDFVVMDEQKREVWIETKGCSLSENGVAKFPDAPTKRGTRHLEELIEIKKSGKRAAVFFLVLRKSKYFTPKKDTDPLFSKTFYEAKKQGVEIYPIQLIYKDGIISYDSILDIK
ncbi:MAG: DNA/RNA nuclease SfsA [Fusobacteriota bacterium]